MRGSTIGSVDKKATLWIDYTGIESLKETLRALPEDLHRNAVRSAMSRAATFIKNHAQESPDFRDISSRLRRGGGKWKGISVYRPRPTKYMTRVAVRASTPYGHLVEFGHLTKKKDGTVVHVEGRRFMSKTWANYGHFATMIIMDGVAAYMKRRQRRITKANAASTLPIQTFNPFQSEED